jgi:RNA polymerase sigma-70 factor (ECF subfamily)
MARLRHEIGAGGRPGVDAPEDRHERTSARVEISVIDSFERFYRAEYSRLVGLGYQLTGRRDVAEDLAQEAMLRAYRSWGKVSSYERPDLWLRRLLINLSASRWRRVRTASRSFVRLWPASEIAEPSADTVEVWRHVRTLPRRQAEVVALYYGCDLSVDEIAATIDCAAGTVRAHLARARASLADRLRTPEET